MTFTPGICAHCGKEIRNGIGVFICAECLGEYLKEQMQQAVREMKKTVKNVCEGVANDRKRRADNSV